MAFEEKNIFINSLLKPQVIFFLLNIQPAQKNLFFEEKTKQRFKYGIVTNLKKIYDTKQAFKANIPKPLLWPAPFDNKKIFKYSILLEIKYFPKSLYFLLIL